MYMCSPMGFYFVSGSHDRTARVWSTDHIQPIRILAGHLSDVDVRESVLIKVLVQIYVNLLLVVIVLQISSQWQLHSNWIK